jgi:hypothetical protein
MENAPATTEAPAMLPVANSMFFDVKAFEHAQRVATMLSKSSMVPDHFRGPENVGNAMIALNYAARIGADPFFVMQGMYVVHGKPGIEGKMMIALINSCGRFEPLRFKIDGDLSKPARETDGCTAWTKERATGLKLEGPKIDWRMVKASGWWDKKDKKGRPCSPWRKYSPVLFPYRAASYFANLFCPEVKMGMQTREELHDIVDVVEHPTGEWSAPETADESGADAMKDFNKLAIRNFATVLPGIEQFVKDTADAQDCKPDEIKAEAVNDWETFSAAFSAWMKKQNDTETDQQKTTTATSTTIGNNLADNRPPEGKNLAGEPGYDFDPDAFFNRFKNMKQAGYKPFLGVEKHKQHIVDGPEWLQEKAVEKWEKLYPDEPFPIDVPAAKKEKDEPDEPSDNLAQLVQTDEWQELSVLQQQHPGIYKQVVASSPKTMDELNQAIETISSMAESGEDSDGMPAE